MLEGQNRIRLCDFGMSKFLEGKEADVCRLGGTTEYCAPEQIQFEQRVKILSKVINTKKIKLIIIVDKNKPNYQPLSPAADMWAIGACTFALLSKISPFRRKELHETQNAVIKGDYNFDDPSWDTRSQDSKDFIRKLLQTCPEVSSVNQALNSVL